MNSFTRILKQEQGTISNVSWLSTCALGNPSYRDHAKNEGSSGLEQIKFSSHKLHKTLEVEIQRGFFYEVEKVVDI